MLVCRNPGPPPERGSHVLGWGSALSGFLVEVLSVRSLRNRVVVPEETSLPKLGEQELNYVFERLGE